MKALKSQWEPVCEVASDVQALLDLSDAASESDEAEFKSDLEKLEAKWKAVEHVLLFSGSHDTANCYLTISSGAGGTDAQDWAEMLVRMYMRYCERKKWKFSILEKTHGQEAGIKSATIYIEGELSYGFLKAERGTHRLVRLSPFNSKNLRQTSFALVEALPEIDSNNEIEINPTDLRIDTFRSSGAGGQHVNVTDSAVRITHAPTNIVVACQNERSQLQNKEQCMKILKSKLLQKKEDEEMKKIEGLKSSTKSADFGQQIRSYVLHPYKMVKDLRTELENNNPDEVLDGDLDEFVFAELRRK